GNFICGLRITADCIGEESIVGFEDWGFIASIPITGSTDGAKTDFPVDITIKYESFMNHDFSDLRFLDSTKTVQLGYEITEFNPFDYAKITVKVPSLAASPSDTNICVLAGNSEAISNSNPENVYVIYDTLENLNNWTITGNVTVTDGVATISSGGSTAYMLKDFNVDYDFIVEIRYKHPSVYRNRPYLTTQSKTGSPFFDYGIFNNIYWNGFTGVTLTNDTWYVMQWINSYNNYTWNILSDDKSTTIFSRSYGSKVADLKRLIFSATENASSVYNIDYVKVKQIANNYPTVGQISAWTGIGNHETSQIFNLNGCVFDESPMSSPRLTSNDLRVSTQEGDYYNITNFAIQKRKSDGTSNFEVIISSSEDEQFLTGQVILFEEIQGNQTRKIYEGIIQEVTESIQGAEKNYNISGRHISLGLINKGSGVLCAGKTVTNRTVNQLLSIILADTGITIGPGVDLNIGNIPNKTTVFPGWCGSYDTKKSALDSLMNMISLKKGKTINWFIDDNNQLRTFYTEDKNGDIGVTITKNNPRLISMTTSENAENIVNDLYGYAGENSDITVHRQDLESINGWTDEDGFEHPGYGLIQGSSVVDNSITSTGMIAQKTQAILNRQSKPIYTVSLILTRFPNVEPGQPLYIPDHYKYNNKTFIVSDITMQGSPGNWITTVLATTDINVVNPVSDFETVQAITRKAVQKSAPKAGVVMEVEGNQYVVQLVNGGTVVNVKGF
ncbi:MAG: DUF2341 domain-containing protein, partial [Methanobacteriaceae archaeon]|nr:DUF2341 domain-containing protein [Methanobacteriaceae archaeon]